MEHIQDLLNNRIEVGDRNERRVLLREIYGLYLKDRVGRKKDNWKRYCRWLREKKMENLATAQKDFKKTKLFIHESTPRNLAVKLSHIPTKDLYYMKSVAQDKLNRKESVGGFIFSSIKLLT